MPGASFYVVEGSASESFVPGEEILQTTETACSLGYGSSVKQAFPPYRYYRVKAFGPFRLAESPYSNVVEY